MLFRFQEKPIDLLFCIAYTLSLSVVLLTIVSGNIVALALVLFLPGYSVVAALFPSEREIDWLERIALSFGLTFAIVPLLGLSLSFSPWGLRFAPIVVTIALFVVLMSFIAFWRRMRLAPSDRLSVVIKIAASDWSEYGPWEKVLAASLAISVIVATTAFALVVLNPRPTSRYTELYLLTTSGAASHYPNCLNVSQTATLIVGINNREQTEVNYTLRVDLVGVILAYNATEGYNTTTEVNHSTLSWSNVTLTTGRDWTQTYNFVITSAGVWKVLFLLFKDAGYAVIYRSVHLFLSVPCPT